jgi:hypothetical protein
MNPKKGGEKKARVNRPFSLLQIYQLKTATFWSDEWGAPHPLVGAFCLYDRVDTLIVGAGLRVLQSGLCQHELSLSLSF